MCGDSRKSSRRDVSQEGLRCPCRDAAAQEMVILCPDGGPVAQCDSDSMPIVRVTRDAVSRLCFVPPIETEWHPPCGGACHRLGGGEQCATSSLVREAHIVYPLRQVFLGLAPRIRGDQDRQAWMSEERTPAFSEQFTHEDVRIHRERKRRCGGRDAQRRDEAVYREASKRSASSSSVRPFSADTA